MAWRFHGRARVNPSAPEAFGRCDACGFWFNHADLQPQMQWTGDKLAPTGTLVCAKDLDEPAPFLRPVILPPDPAPVLDPRPENFVEATTDYRTTTLSDRRVTEDGDPRITQPTGDDMLEALYG